MTNRDRPYATITKHQLNTIDKSKMYTVYDKWPELAQNAYKPNLQQLPITYDGTITDIVFAGMGGSGAIGDIFASILSKTAMHVTVTKGYELPKTINKNTLIVTTSISGNTQETLTILKAAVKTDAKTIAVSSGGEIEQFCKRNNNRHIKIKQIHSPRASLVIAVFAMLKALEDILPIHKKDVTEAITRLKDVQKNISSHNSTDKNNDARNLAFLLNGIPLVYYPFGLQAAAVRFKNSFQENAKRHAMIEDIVEASHNGIVAWEMKSSVIPVMIIGSDDHPKTKQRQQILLDYFVEHGIMCEQIKTGQGGILAKLMELIYYCDYTSIYRAVYDKIDPTPVRSIKYVKDRL